MAKQKLFIPDKIKEFFSRINESVAEAKNSEHLLTLMSQLATEEFDADRASIFLRDKQTGQLRLIAGIGIPREIIESHPAAEQKNISWWVSKERKAIILKGLVKKDPRFRSLSSTAISSSIVIPLIFENEVIGVFNLSRIGEEKAFFTEDDMVLFKVLGDLVVVSLQLLLVQEKKIHNEQLAAIGLATAEIIHSLKNLLVGIFGAVELLNVLIKQEEWQSVKENWNLLVESIKDISTVINKTLSYSKTDSVVKEEIVLNNLLREISDFIKPRCNISGIKLFYSCFSEKIILWANRESIYNAIMNIIDNALKVMTTGGELKIFCDIESESKFARIIISDTGYGIPSENLSRIFEPFFTTDNKKGTGIGLALTKKIIESHGGSIAVDSKPGAGTTFTIKLPFVKVQ